MDVIFRDKDVSLAVHAGVNIAHVVDSIRARHVEPYRAWLRANPSFPYVTIVDAGSSPPASALRRSLMDAFSRMECQLAVLAVLQTGFRGSISRSVATAMVGWTRLPFTVRITGSIDEAVHLIELNCGRRDGLGAAMHELVAQAEREARRVAADHS